MSSPDYPRTPGGAGPQSHPLFELTRARFLEFIREPEAVFWVFVFPVIMALALGYAFREKPPEAAAVGVTGKALSDLVRRALADAPLIKPRLFPSVAEGRTALASGKIALLIENGSPLVYWYDPTRPESRIARLGVNEAVQKASGRGDTTPVRDQL